MLDDIIIRAKTAHKEKLEEAGAIGHIAHNWIEEYIKAILAKDLKKVEEVLANMPADERARNACVAALDWMNSHNVRWIGTERKPLYSAKDLKEKQRFFGLITLTYKADTLAAASET